MTLEPCYWRRFGVFFVNFEQISYIILVNYYYYAEFKKVNAG